MIKKMGSKNEQKLTKKNDKNLKKIGSKNDQKIDSKKYPKKVFFRILKKMNFGNFGFGCADVNFSEISKKPG